MNNKWRDSIVDAATAGESLLPWTRGAARQAMIQRRKARSEDEQNVHSLEAKSA